MASPPWLLRLDQLGRLLPTTLRERVFEPACADLVLNEPGRSTRRGLTLRFVGVLVWVIVTNLPRALIERRRLTGAGILLGSVALLGGGALLVGAWYVRALYGYPTP